MSMNTSLIRDINSNRDRERHKEFDSTENVRLSIRILARRIPQVTINSLFYKIKHLDSTTSDGTHVCFVRKNEAQ